MNGFRLASALATLVFVACVAVQYNDPDALIWIVAYSAAVVLSAAAVWRRFVPVLTACLALIYLAWSGSLLPGVWRSRDLLGEEAREAFGLLLAVVWLTLLFFAGRRQRAADPESPK